jgi:hypothetical protein
MLLEDKELPELFEMKHRHDDQPYVDWGNNILNKSLSPYLYKNDMMNQYLIRIQKLVAIIFDQQNFMKNFKNYMVDKYFYKHTH